MAMDEDKLARGHSRQRQDHEGVGTRLDEARLAAIRHALARGGSDADVARQVGSDALGTPEHTEAVRQRNEGLASRQKEALDRPGKAARSRETRADKIESAERRSEAVQKQLRERTERASAKTAAPQAVRTPQAARSHQAAKTPQEARAEIVKRSREDLNRAGRQSQQSREQGGRDRVRSR